MSKEAMNLALNLLRKKEWEACDYTSNASEAADILEKALAEQPAQQGPAATVAEVHMSRYTIEWTNGPLPEGTELYTSPQPVRQPLTDAQISLDAHNIDPGDWNDLRFRDSWHKGFKEGVRAGEAAHGITKDTK